MDVDSLMILDNLLELLLHFQSDKFGKFDERVRVFDREKMGEQSRNDKSIHADIREISVVCFDGKSW